MSMSVKTIARRPTFGDVVVTKTGRLFTVTELIWNATHTRIEVVGVTSLDDRLPNAFYRSEVKVVAKGDANHAREAAKLAQLDRELAETERIERELVEEMDARLLHEQRAWDEPSADDMRQYRRPRDLDMSDVEADAQRMQDEQRELDEARVTSERRVIALHELAITEERIAERRAADERLLTADLIHALSTHPLTHDLKVREIASLAEHVAAMLLTSDDLRVIVTPKER